MKKPDSKRRRTDGVSRRVALTVEAGKLSLLLEMPLDILYEVLMHVWPVNLLNLARTSKQLRDHLMSRGWSSVWRAAFENDPDKFPPLPEGMNEPQYADLTTMSYCQHCLAPVADCLWCLKRRLCSRCQVGTTVHSVAALNAGWPPTQPMDILLNEFVSTPYKIPVHIVADIDEVRAALDACSDEGAIQVYRAKRLRVVEAMHKFRDDCSESMLARVRRVADEKAQARLQRRAAITQKLQALGHSEEIAYLEENPVRAREYWEHQDVSSSIPLYDDEFKAIYPRLRPLMSRARETLNARKQRRLNSTRLQILSKLLEQHTIERPSKMLPSLADLAFLPEIKKILEIKDVNRYSVDSDFAAIQKMLPKLCKEWRRSQQERLAAIMPRGLNVSHLCLAMTFFQCDDCPGPIGYPNIFSHQCLRTLRPGYRNREDDVVRLLDTLGEEPWNMEPRSSVTWNKNAAACAVDVVREVGLSPRDATPEDMDRADVEWLECLTCRDPVKQRSRVYQWRTAIVHGMEHLSLRQPAVWSRVTRAEDIKAAEDEDIVQAEARSKHHVPIHACSLCQLGVPRHLRADHLKLAHAADEGLRLSTTFTPSPHAPLEDQPYKVIIPLSRRPTVKAMGQPVLDLTADDSQSHREVIELDDSDDDVIEILE